MMRLDYFLTSKRIKYIMMLLNFIIIFYYASIILLGTKYIIDQDQARLFLDKIDYIPNNPLYTFFVSLSLYGILMMIIWKRPAVIIENKKWNMIYSMIESGVCFLIISVLYMGYSGLVFLVFCDCIYYLRNNKYFRWIILSLVMIYFVSHYEIISSFYNIMDIQQYFTAFSPAVTGTLMISINVLETINIILFIVFMVIFISDQIRETENIAKELDMIHQVNEELKNYAAVTEKIGEDNERKRLARELHDTLGHALTGIAAGVDACVAMIDINPKATKQQLMIVSSVVRQGIGDVRNSLNKLRPNALKEKGFKGALEKMIDEFSSVSSLDIILDYQIDVDMDTTKEDTLFRIIQESITNGVRHGGATKIDIRFACDDKNIYLIIQDNGKGCDDIHFGFGLKQMQERVAIMNGTIQYNGENGFMTRVIIPI